MNPRQLAEIHDRKLARAYDKAGLEQYKHPVDILEPEAEASLVTQFAELLTPMFSYIAKGRLGGTMDIRSWVVLYCAGHVAGETIAQFAVRRGVSANRVHTLVKEFKAGVPQLRTDHQKTAATRARMSAAHRAPTPPR